jgi:8-oxo-dGTP diphosphatase
MDYVCGFLFHPQHREVALVRKNKPEWQKGKLNGVGGKIEIGESPSAAMEREFLEEAGVRINRWKLIRIEKFSNGAPDGNETTSVHFFCATAQEEEWESIRQMESEEIVKWSGDINNKELMYNLRYLIPMCEVLSGMAPKYVPAP